MRSLAEEDSSREITMPQEREFYKYKNDPIAAFT